MRRLLAATVLATAVLTGCGSSPKVAVAAHGVSVRVEPPFDRLPFDPASVRIAEAMRQLEAIVAHPIAIEVDRALLPAGAEVERLLAATIETIAKDLVDARRDNPDAFAIAVPKLERIVLRHDAVRGEAHFEDGAVVVRESPSSYALVGRETVSSALLEEYRRGLEARFGNREPEQIAAADRAAYVDYLVRFRHAKTEPWPVTVERLVRMDALLGASEPATTERLRSWLLEQAVALGRAGDGATLHAKQVWIAWLNRVLPALAPDQKTKVVLAMLDGTSSYGYQSGPASYEGFDFVAFGLAVADDWVAAGHPLEGPPNDARFRLFDHLLCPPGLDARGQLWRGAGCGALWYRVALATEADTRRVADALDARGDARLVEAVFYGASHVPDVGRRSARWALFRALEAHPKTWRVAATGLIAEAQARDGCGTAFVAEANHAWRAVPELRGTALAIIGCEKSHWGVEYAQKELERPRFVRLYGELVAEPVFAKMLSDSPEALAIAPYVWTALAPGFSRAAVVVPRLEGFLSDPAVRTGKRNGEPDKTLRAIVQSMCAEKRPDEAGRVYDALVQLSKKDATNGRLVAPILLDMAGRRCPRPR